MQQLKVREGKSIHSQGGNVCNKLTVLYKMPLRIAEGRELIPQRDRDSFCCLLYLLKIFWMQPCLFKKNFFFFFPQKTFYWVTVAFQEKASCLCCGFLGYPLETHLTQFFQKLKNISYKACIGGNPIFLVETNRTSIKKRQRSLIRKWYQGLISREWRLQIIILLSFFFYLSIF